MASMTMNGSQSGWRRLWEKLEALAEAFESDGLAHVEARMSRIEQRLAALEGDRRVAAPEGEAATW